MAIRSGARDGGASKALPPKLRANARARGLPWDCRDIGARARVPPGRLPPRLPAGHRTLPPAGATGAAVVTVTTDNITTSTTTIATTTTTTIIISITTIVVVIPVAIGFVGLGPILHFDSDQEARPRGAARKA